MFLTKRNTYSIANSLSNLRISERLKIFLISFIDSVVESGNESMRKRANFLIEMAKERCGEQMEATLTFYCAANTLKWQLHDFNSFSEWLNLPQRRQFSRKYGTFGIVYQRPHSIRPKFCRDTKNPFSAYFVNCKLVIGFSLLMLGAYVRWKRLQFQLKWKIKSEINKLCMFSFMVIKIPIKLMAKFPTQDKRNY